MKGYYAIEKGEFDELLEKLIEYSAGTKSAPDLSRKEATVLAFCMIAVEKTQPENIEKDSQIYKVEL